MPLGLAFQSAFMEPAQRTGLLNKELIVLNWWRIRTQVSVPGKSIGGRSGEGKVKSLRKLDWR
jgi:hypothetical protein